MKDPLLPHGASSKEKALLAIHPRSSELGILAFSRKLKFVSTKSLPNLRHNNINLGNEKTV